MLKIDSQRASLQAEIASLETRLLALRSQLNSLSPSNRIPTDILLEIFSLVRGDPTSNFGWVRGVTDVCSHWRTIALSQRELWATIFLFPNHVKLKTPIFTLLERSNGCPLMVHVSSSSILLEDGTLGSFGIHPHRLRGLRAETCNSVTDISQILCVEDDVQTPLLQTLRVTTCSSDFQSIPALTTFLRQECPSLRELCIPGLFFSPTDLQMLNLTDLSLSGGSVSWSVLGPANPSVTKPYDILASLTRHSGLRYLSLEGQYVDYYESLQSSEELTLPSLSSLTISNASIRSVLNVLRSISCTSPVEIACIDIFTGDRREYADIGATEVHELVKLMLQFCRLQGSHLFLNRLLERGYYMFALRLEDNARVLFHLAVIPTDVVVMTTDDRTLFNSLLGPLDPSTFSHVTFQGTALMVADLPFFCTCLATTITAEPWGSSEGVSLATPPGRSFIPFPFLKNIEIVHLDGWSQAIELTSTLWWRFRRGLSPPLVTFIKYEKRVIDEMSRILLPVVTKGTFLTQPSGELEQLPWVDVELEQEYDSQEDTDEDEDVESGDETDSQYGSWMLHPDVSLGEEEDSSDDYAPPESDDEYESDWDSDLEEP